MSDPRKRSLLLAASAAPAVGAALLTTPARATEDFLKADGSYGWSRDKGGRTFLLRPGGHAGAGRPARRTQAVALPR
ncbi:hypothetical protein A6P39_011120 [Streptomyces sp. FXJ1.172]|uniref:hypothetical protein n=1 Tax=Streptomyces sp. FXJ1.172 TaxID=710705 RepID=UPI001F249554|nr:hypothetical protein [Streptomyces sp. FXJ1.172]WEO94517.1 hypothetical protein A6P39_011120 [Streptomyces sp. FXJ1.172]